ncbi:DNA topoisomerase [Parachaetomium inaequale]|uniref:DNA topoisomerase n=1 Tax=Parachaetomium inaequale TaxID=2588326 RepID=A0AAN6SU51_9PEZI|nr:DNA topoisomerase [Parachaetomium inaequale]
MTRILCVAEKPSISKAVAGHLSGGHYQTNNTRDAYIKNYTFDFDFGPPWGHCSVTMTAVKGHLTAVEFPGEYKQWEYPPPDRLFDAPVLTVIPNDNKSIAKNIEDQARRASALVIWTDCDREGEHIGSEIRAAARKGNAQIQIKRARFSNVERAHILSAARRLIALDDRQVDAVSARIELDLRIGYAFTRFLTLNLRPLGGPLSKLTLSYGSCQFPTLGFVVDRYFRVKNFVPEPFWGIKVMHERDDIKVNFNWSRHRLFDRMSVVILYERCLSARTAKVTKVQEKPTKKWKPLPLTTVELQKMATRFLRMTGQQAMTVAEKLYNKGFISYPRTETDRFDKGMNLRALVQKQTQDARWGPFAQNLVDGGFQQPRQGRHDDKAHPPIHPITYAAPTALDDSERRVYELVTRRFLACCAEDARGSATDVELLYGDEAFAARGVVVLARNYLDVYPYENWTGTAELPRFVVGERFEPTEAMVTEGKTSPPGYLTEADLIALMDANGIGTDATMAEHIEKIQERQYARTVERGGGGGGNQAAEEDEPEPPAAAARGGRGRGRGRGGGRGGARGGRGGPAPGRGGGVREFIPTSLGVALIEGFDRMHFETSLGKPFLRKEMELKMKAICEGRTTKQVVLHESLGEYRQVYEQSRAELNILKAACRQYVFQNGG